MLREMRFDRKRIRAGRDLHANRFYIILVQSELFNPWTGNSGAIPSPDQNRAVYIFNLYAASRIQRMSLGIGFLNVFGMNQTCSQQADENQSIKHGVIM